MTLCAVLMKLTWFIRGIRGGRDDVETVRTWANADSDPAQPWGPRLKELVEARRFLTEVAAS